MDADRYVEIEGEREGWRRKSEGGREREEGGSKYKLLCTTAYNTKPDSQTQEWNESTHKLYATHHCPLWCVCVDSCLVAAELVASHYCGCGTSLLRV